MAVPRLALTVFLYSRAVMRAGDFAWFGETSDLVFAVAEFFVGTLTLADVVASTPVA